MTILVTGGAGYIGSHTVIELLVHGHEVVVIDDLSNSSEESLKRVEKITGKKVPFVKADVADRAALDKIFDAYDIEAVIHFAGWKSVGESVAMPITYYRNNLNTTLTLCEAMQDHGVQHIVFSSSATVYGVPQDLPLTEDTEPGPISNPYGQTKAMIEQILHDMVTAYPDWRVTILRYFNPIGAHASGLIGEDPNDIPNNLMPYITQVAIGKHDKLRIFGDDYHTPDGTGVRDYIHVVDLARGHVAALEHAPLAGEVAIYNLGTGKGTSVLELLHAFEKACGKKLPYEVVDRRPGDIAACYADASLAESELQWEAEKTIEEACADSWRWQSQNPNGYKV